VKQTLHLSSPEYGIESNRDHQLEGVYPIRVQPIPVPLGCEVFPGPFHVRERVCQNRVHRIGPETNPENWAKFSCEYGRHYFGI
jgi:hypothetical protein